MRASRSRARSRSAQLVAFYGYAVFLVMPLRTLDRGGRQDHHARSSPPGACVRGPAAASRELADPPTPAAEPRPGGDLVDAESGLVVRPAMLIAIAGRRSPRTRPPSPTGSAAIADGPVTLGRRPADRICRSTRCGADPGRRQRRAAVHRAAARRARPAGPGRRDDTRADAAIAAASAEDIVEALPDGLDT